MRAVRLLLALWAIVAAFRRASRHPSAVRDRRRIVIQIINIALMLLGQRYPARRGLLRLIAIAIGLGVGIAMQRGRRSK